MTAHNLPKSPKSFLIRVDQIPLPGIHIDETLHSDWLNQLLHEKNKEFSWITSNDVHVVLNVKKEPEFVTVSGTIQCSVLSPCVRCLDDVLMKMNVDVRLHMLPGQKKEDDEEVDMDPQDATETLDVGGFIVDYYQNGVIDVTSLIREELFLALPLYPTCEDGMPDKKTCHFETVSVAPKGQTWEGPFDKLKKLQ